MGYAADREEAGTANIIGETELDLALLAEIAFENSPDTRQVWQMARVAAEQAKRAESAHYPHLSLRAGIAKEYEKPTLFLHPALSLNYVVFSFGANGASVEAAREHLHAADFHCKRSLQTLLHRVQMGYFSLSAAEAMAEARAASFRDAEEVCKSAEVRLQAGLGDRQSVLQARANALQGKFRLEEAEASVERMRAALAEAVGVPVGGNFRIRRSQLPDEICAIDGDVEQLLARALAGRPDLLAVRSQLSAAEDLEKFAARDGLAKCMVSANGSFSSVRHRGTARSYDAFIGLSWDLFDGFDGLHRRLEQRARRQAAFESLRAAELRAVGEVWAQHAAYRAALRQLEAARALRAAAEESFNATETAQRSGLATFLDLLHAQTTLAAARESLVLAESNYSTSLATLAYVSGDLEPFCN
jgi:outer membrane protein TolC